MNKFGMFLKRRKWYLVILAITSFVCAIYFNATGKDDSSFKDILLYICLPTLIIPGIYTILTYKKAEINSDNKN